MADIRLAIALMALLSVVLFTTTVRLLRQRSPLFLDFMGIVAILLLGAYLQLVWGQLWIVNWIPLPSVIVLANWFPLLLGFLAAIVWLRMKQHPLWRRIPVQVALIAMTVWSVIYVIPREPPDCNNEWIARYPGDPLTYCRQTTTETCSAASAATLLATLGIDTTEQEMAELCLTRHGTSWLGLYHGLSWKLLGTDRVVQLFEADAGHLRTMCAEQPVLLCCELTDDTAAVNPQLVNEDGWQPGVAHSVVCFGHNEHGFLIADPSQPQPETWDDRYLNALWTGTGLRIIATE
ncbi:MAG: hypothetical protein KDA85_09125 [Planctomycetaceae bacterium]|nr:hypothetical protein [Planctomycetaceae bacterium]